MYNEDQLYGLIDDKTNDDDTNQLTRLKEVLQQFLNKLNALDTTRYTKLLKTTISPSTSTDAQDFLFKFKKRQESDEEVKWGAWTNWSTCSVSCGKGRKIRWRHCRSNAPENYNRRKSIRETWGNKQAQIEVLFMLGSVTDSKVQRELEEENKKYQDIVQGAFIDNYRNLTYKHVMVLKYAIYHCPQAKYILKTDDDVFVNMPTMLNFLTLELSPHGAKNFLLCPKQEYSPVMRSNSKWVVSVSEYAEPYYPPYCLGIVIMYSPDVVFSLYQELQKSKYFWIDDVLVTGIARKKLNITISNVYPLVLSGDMTEKVTHDKNITDTLMFLYGPIDVMVTQIYSLYAVVKNGTSYKCILSLIK
ncbi:hypothetical protein RN001_009719 [Aquatica leii]|uniref:Hexosyltransferase n=1 Tax=Aquatica leii TaxID=1421715 RepID=A0AAN7SN04_9COLE|nr:hypothetical protein RN001_009719 [Aquatica leii]